MKPEFALIRVDRETRQCIASPRDAGLVPNPKWRGKITGGDWRIARRFVKDVCDGTMSGIVVAPKADRS